MGWWKLNWHQLVSGVSVRLQLLPSLFDQWLICSNMHNSHVPDKWQTKSTHNVLLWDYIWTKQEQGNTFMATGKAIGRVWYEWKLTNKKILERKQDHDAMNPSWITESLSVSKIIIPDISNRCATIHRMKLHTTQEYIYHQTCPISAIKISSTDWAQHHSGKHQTDDRCSAAVALSIHISIQSTVLTFASWNSSRFVLRSFENVA